MVDLTSRKILIIEDDSVSRSQVISAAVDELVRELGKQHVDARRATSYDEAKPVVVNDTDLDAILLSTDMELNRKEESAAYGLLALIRERQVRVPLFLLADRKKTAEALSSELMNNADEFIWIFEDSPFFIAGRIHAAIDHYRAQLLPPLMRAIWEYNQQNHEYSWAAPGHQGGRGFTKGAAGKKFYDFYGENLFRTDTGIERASIGSLLDHTHAFGESEKLAAKVFGSEITFSGVVGTSGSNRAVMQSVLAPDDVAVCDRNCHKSIEQGLILSGALPVYLIPTRNRYGIIGPIPPEEMSAQSIEKKIAASPFKITGDKRAYAVVTNCTYDGICYNAKYAEKLLSESVDRIHFDEAWYAYARFNPLYADCFAMRGDPKRHRGATVFATHSTHKLLTALSQASFIHLRNGRKPISFDQLNQAYMMHATTSPLYAICASNDVAVKMMADNGDALTQEVIDEAVDFRQALAKMERDFLRKKSWFFKVWNAPEVTCPKSGKKYNFADAPHDLLAREQSCWHLRPGEVWHGFDRLPDEPWAMLDPIKVSILTPGMGDDGKIEKCGIPALLVSQFIYDAGIVPTRSTDFQLMFLFSMGITRGKWVTLLNALLKFKRLYDANAPLTEALPEIVAAAPERYASLGLRDLGDEMFAYLRENDPGAKLNAAFETLPEAVLTPRDAYMQIVRGNVEMVPADQLGSRIAANSVIPYPPGIPMVISGERFAAKDSPQIAYLQALAAWDARFPGFEHVTEGCDNKDGVCRVPCVINP